MTQFLRDFLEMNLPKAAEGKKSHTKLGVLDTKIGNVIQEALGVKCESSEVIQELFRFALLWVCLSHAMMTEAFVCISFILSKRSSQEV